MKVRIHLRNWYPPIVSSLNKRDLNCPSIIFQGTYWTAVLPLTFLDFFQIQNFRLNIQSKNKLTIGWYIKAILASRWWVELFTINLIILTKHCPGFVYGAISSNFLGLNLMYNFASNIKARIAFLFLDFIITAALQTNTRTYEYSNILAEP